MAIISNFFIHTYHIEYCLLYIAKKKKTDWLDDKFMIWAKMRNWDRDSDNSDDDAQEIEME